MRGAFVVVTWLLCFSPVNSFADNAAEQKSSYVTEADFLGEIPIAVSASRLTQSLLDAPVSITIIDRDMIKASGATELVDVLRLVPGFQVAHANGNVFVAAYHGLADDFPRRMQVLVDGRSVYLPLVSNANFATLGVALEDIERIEVVQGSDAAVYGSNAFSATVSIITRQPFQEHGAYVLATVGSIATHNALLRYADTIGAFDYRISVTTQSDEGFENVNDGKHVRGVNFRGTYSPNTKDALDVQSGYNAGSVGAWADGTGASPLRDYDVRDGYGSLRWRHSLDDSQDIQLQFYHNQHERHDRLVVLGTWSELSGIVPELVEAQTGHPDQLITTRQWDGESRSDDIEFQHTWIVGAALRLAWGGGLRSDRARSQTWFGHDGWISNETTRVFGQVEWRAAPNFLFNAGAMVEHNSLIESAASPRVSINYMIADGHVIRLATARAKRTPSFIEEYFDMGARFNDGSFLQPIFHSFGNIKPERLTSYELGYTAELRRFACSWDVKLFREELRNFYSFVDDPAYSQQFFFARTKVSDDTGRINIHGAEARISFKPTRDLLITAQYSYARADGGFPQQINSYIYAEAAASMPVHVASALAAYTLQDRWQVSMAYYHMDHYTTIQDGDHVGGYNRYDARVAKEFMVSSVTGEIALIGQNLFDSYTEFQEDNVFERRTYVQLGMQF